MATVRKERRRKQEVVQSCRNYQGPSNLLERLEEERYGRDGVCVAVMEIIVTKTCEKGRPREVRCCLVKLGSRKQKLFPPFVDE